MYFFRRIILYMVHVLYRVSQENFLVDRANGKLLNKMSTIGRASCGTVTIIITAYTLTRACNLFWDVFRVERKKKKNLINGTRRPMLHETDDKPCVIRLRHGVTKVILYFVFIQKKITSWRTLTRCLYDPIAACRVQFSMYRVNFSTIYLSILMSTSPPDFATNTNRIQQHY